MYKQLLIGILIGLLTPVCFGADIYDIDGKDVIIESSDEEVFNVGDYLFVKNSKGKRKAVLKITNDRGTLYDAKVVYGKPKSGYEVTGMTASQKKKVLNYIKKKRRKKNV